MQPLVRGGGRLREGGRRGMSVACGIYCEGGEWSKVYLSSVLRGVQLVVLVGGECHWSP